MAIPKKAFVEVMIGSKVSTGDRDIVARVLANHGHTAKITQSAI
jgi:hypothetical protein